MVDKKRINIHFNPKSMIQSILIKLVLFATMSLYVFSLPAPAPRGEGHAGGGGGARPHQVGGGGGGSFPTLPHRSQNNGPVPQDPNCPKVPGTNSCA